MTGLTEHFFSKIFCDCVACENGKKMGVQKLCYWEFFLESCEIFWDCVACENGKKTGVQFFLWLTLTMPFFLKKLTITLSSQRSKKKGVQFFVQKVRKLNFSWKIWNLRKQKSVFQSQLLSTYFFYFTTYIVWVFFSKNAKCPQKTL